jgi:hypothetical protein
MVDLVHPVLAITGSSHIELGCLLADEATAHISLLKVSKRNWTVRSARPIGYSPSRHYYFKSRSHYPANSIQLDHIDSSETCSIRS